MKVCSTHTKRTFIGPFPGLPGWAGTRKVKPIWTLLKQKTMSGSGISWAICKSAPRSRQITTPAPQHSVFTGRLPFLPPNQQWLKATYSFQIVLQNHYATDDSTDADLFQCRSLDRRCGFPTTISRALARVTATLNLWITYTQSTHSSMTSEFKDLFADLSRTTTHILKDTPAHR